MKKILPLVLVFIAIFIAACQKPADVAQTPAGLPEDVGDVAPAGDASVDAVAQDLDNINTADQELSTDGLSDLDSGLSDVENI